MSPVTRKKAGSQAGRGRGGARSGPHTALVNVCLEYLTRSGVWARKMNTGSFIAKSGHLVKAAFPGCSDIIGILGPTGRFFAIEVKTGRGELNDDQVIFEADVLDEGGIFITARSLDDLRPLLAQAGGYSVTG
jgi:hypothetical protein